MTRESNQLQDCGDVIANSQSSQVVDDAREKSKQEQFECVEDWNIGGSTVLSILGVVNEHRVCISVYEDNNASCEAHVDQEINVP